MDKLLVNRLDKRIAILRPADPEKDQDESGQPLEGYVPVTTIWASIEPLRGREFFAAQAENAEVTTRIRVRYREGIDRTMIARYGDYEFEILFVIHPELSKKELQLMCKERQ